MLFTTRLFLVGFLPPVLLGWWLLRPPRLRLAWLAFASYVFYAFWDWRFLPIVLVSTGVDFLAGRTIARSEHDGHRRALLVAALAVNLGLLGLFKYAGFFADTANVLAVWLGIGRPLPIMHLILPLGISFYTFNSISYTIDVYRRQIPPEPSALRYCAFVVAFPHLIAGPIVRYESMAGQLRRLQPRLTGDLLSRGLFFISCGFAKKLLLADSLAPTVDRLFAHHAQLGLIGSWLAALGYSLQLYFDFSGYCDIAIGLALLLGFTFPQNFDSPFTAANISDFWRRWHMSLSSWLRDYLFIPLGGSRGGAGKTARNLAIVILLGGLWHGAATTFVVWGAIHGMLLAAHGVLRARGLTPRSAIVNRAATFLCVVAAFVVFRAPDLGVAADLLGGMVGFRGLEHGAAASALLDTRFAVTVACLIVFVNVVPNTWRIRFRAGFGRGLSYGLVFGAAIIAIGGPSPFLYYQF